MMDLRRWALPVLAAAAAAGPAVAQPAAEAEHARPSLVSEYTALVPGRENWVGITFEIDPHWHLYWNGVNDSGMAVKVAPELPEGFKAGALLWPAPKRLVSPGDILDHIYEDRVTLLMPVHVPADAAPGSKATLAAGLEWLVCHDICLPGDARVSLTLPIASPGQSPVGSKHAALFKEARERLPKPSEEAGSALEVGWEDGSAVVTFRDAKALAFYPAAESVELVDPIASATAETDRLTMEYEMPESGQPRLVGVLEVTPRGRGPSKLYALNATGPMRIEAPRRPAGEP